MASLADSSNKGSSHVDGRVHSGHLGIARTLCNGLVLSWTLKGPLDPHCVIANPSA